MSATFLLLLTQAVTGCYLFKGSTTERKNKCGKEKESHHFTHKSSNSTKYCQWLRKYSWLNGGSWILMYFQEAHVAPVAHQAGEGQSSAGETTANTQCSTLHWSFTSAPVSVPGWHIRTKPKPDIRMGRVLVHGCILTRKYCLSPWVYELLCYMFLFIALLHPTAWKPLLVNTLALPCSHCFSSCLF